MDRWLRDASLRFALATLPAPLLQLGFDLAALSVMLRRPAIADRLRPWCGACILVEPQDVPCALALTIADRTGWLRLVVAGDAERDRATARVSGPVARLLDLVEGSVDGDALFFARDLSISGDTEAIVALRNALDGEEVDLVDDLLWALGPLAGPARAALATVAGLAAAVGNAAGLSPERRLVARGRAGRIEG